MKHRRRRQKAAGSAEVNLTPMLDVVFIMLIFFIVTASFTKESGLDVSRSDPAEQTEEQREEQEGILVQIDSTGTIFLNGRRTDVGAVRANIERSLAETPEAPVVIQAADEAKNGVFVHVLDEARSAGASQVAIAAQ